MTLLLDHIYHGDCRSVLATLPERSVDLIFADPPYNLQLRGELWRPNMTQVDAVDDAWDQFDDFDAYDRFTREWLGACRRVLKDTGTLWVIGSYHNIYRVGSIMQDLGFWFLNDVVWIKCLAGDTELSCLINDRPSVSKLKDLARIDPQANAIKLPSYDESGCFTWVEVAGFSQTQQERGLRIVCEDGSWVECTPGHRFPVLRAGAIEFVPAHSLTLSDTLLKLPLLELPVAADTPALVAGADNARADNALLSRKSSAGLTPPLARQILEGDLVPLRIKAIGHGSVGRFYDIGLARNHVFALANGLLTHNSNPMPQFRGVRFTNAHETLLWAKKSKDQKRYTFNYHTMKAMNEGKQMRSDWLLPLCTGHERLRVDGEKLHSTQKPEALLYRVILSSSNPGDVVLDPFFGSGTTGAVARRVGRRYVGVEREQRYIDAALERIAAVVPVAGDAEIYGLSPSRRGQQRIAFSALLELGLLLPGAELYFDAQRDNAATVLADGTLRTSDGIRGSIHQVAAQVSHQPACNGWDHWCYENEQGALVPIAALRERVRAGDGEGEGA